MSSFERTARQNWQGLAPSAVEQMENPDEFFRAKAQEAQEMFDAILPGIEGPDVPGESYLEKVGRLNAARLQAEATVNEQVLTPPQDEQEELEEPEPDEEAREHAQAMSEIQQLIEQARQEADEQS